MKRMIIIVLDSVGVGELPDAALYGDQGANTVGNIADRYSLQLPNMRALGFGHIRATRLAADPQARGGYGRMAEKSPGKDTTTGHWEIAGLQLSQPFPTFPDGFPVALIDRFERLIGTETLGNVAASGTAIINELGEEHLRTGYPIVYTSADSVFQIAMHEEMIPLERQYEICQTARALLTGRYAVGRVIARPFVGERNGAFTRTGNRRDFSLDPPGDTVLDLLKRAGHDVIGIGKIGDIFNERGLTESDHVQGNEGGIDAAVNRLRRPFNGLMFVNLVDYDMLYGHRRDVEGYARALEAFDVRLPEVLEAMDQGDLLVITADHGCDPTHHGTDHTREYVPLLAYMKGMTALVPLGERATFADVAATAAHFFGLAERFNATSFLEALYVKEE